MSALGRLAHEVTVAHSPTARPRPAMGRSADDMRRVRGSVAFGVLFACLVLAGCMSEDILHYDGVTTSAGDAIAANSVLQMVDPWPAGVEETRLRTPAERGTAEASESAHASDVAVGTTD